MIVEVRSYRIKQGRRAPTVEVGNIDVTRDFSDVRDVVRAYLSLLEAGTSGEAYNVCSGIERHVREVLQRVNMTQESETNGSIDFRSAIPHSSLNPLRKQLGFC